ncbi:hypothetical protein NHX12_030126 [Muraenolepis orangiensis]|uniref:MKRN2 opposite strand protein-like C-terminal domain-containing protein n=1 Tax=Muraenolepis orangiensis TaxID=630683 RepID=A0A9Q0ILK9_9TELE|nr:hypothetical protein NHX12_030126 [Muraenolepis orangiensis]
MKTIVRFRHCGRLIYSLSPREEEGPGGTSRSPAGEAGEAGGTSRSPAGEAGGTSSPAGEAGGDRRSPAEGISRSPAGEPAGDRSQCPLCGERLSFRLLDAPVVVTSPFSNGHETKYSFLISSRSGPTSISNYPSADLVTPNNHQALLTFSAVRSWDRHLETFSSQERWTTDRFAEEGEFGSCCYGFALSFINEVRRSEVMELISQQSFTLGYVLPTVHCSSKVFDGKSELHTGISDTKGVVYNYTRQGVVRDHTGWEQSIRVVLVQQDSFSLRNQWNKYLESYSAGALWDPAWTGYY